MKYNNHRYSLNVNIKKIILKCYVSYLSGKGLWFLISCFLINYYINSNIKITFHPSYKVYSFEITMNNESCILDINFKIINTICNSKNYYWFCNNIIKKNYLKKKKLFFYFIKSSFINLEIQDEDLYLLKLFNLTKYLVKLEYSLYFKPNNYIKYNYNLLSFLDIIYKNKY